MSAAPTASGTASGGLSAPGSLPADFTPSSVTWDSLSSGWVIGQAGTAGHCANANPDICTSIAHTSDGGQTWSGLPAPSTGGPESATGVTGLRFLNATYGWAFGPELWATGNGGQSWHQVSTGGSAVTDLETAGQRAYALFGQCSPPAGSSGDTIANCTSYTLMTAVAGSDSWTAVSGIPAKLRRRARGSAGSAQLVLAGSTGYLTGPDGTLYAGPLDGSAWHTMSALPCTSGGSRQRRPARQRHAGRGRDHGVRPDPARARLRVGDAAGRHRRLLVGRRRDDLGEGRPARAPAARPISARPSRSPPPQTGRSSWPPWAAGTAIGGIY